MPGSVCAPVGLEACGNMWSRPGARVWGLRSLWEELRTEEYLEEVSKGWKHLEGVAWTCRESERIS